VDGAVQRIIITREVYTREEGSNAQWLATSLE